MVKSKFFHYFPIPAFLQMPAAGIHVADAAVRFVRFADTDMALRVDSYDETPLPEGAIVNGNMADREAVVKALSELRQKHRLKLVRGIIPDEKAYLFKIFIPVLPKEEVRSAIEFKIEENVPIALADTVFDYTVLREHGAKDQLEIVVAAAHRKAVGAYLDALRAAGLQPVALELESQAIASAVIPRSEDGVVLVAHFEEGKTGLYLAERGVVEFSITLGGDAGPSSEPAKAAAGAPASGKESASYQKLYSPKYKKLPLVIDEIGRIVNYWKSRQDMKEDFKVIASGSLSADPEFVEHFSGLLKKEVAVGGVWANAFSTEEHIPDMSKEQSFRYAAAIGAAIAGITHRFRDV